MADGDSVMQSYELPQWLLMARLAANPVRTETSFAALHCAGALKPPPALSPMFYDHELGAWIIRTSTSNR